MPTSVPQELDNGRYRIERVLGVGGMAVVLLALDTRIQTYRAIKRVYAKQTGTSAPYARLPDVTIRSPKMSKERSTAWFARSVDTRFQRCLERYRAQEPKPAPRPAGTP